MSEQRITAVKKSSLEGLSEGWGDECYAIVRPATFDDMLELDSLGKKSHAEQVAYQKNLVSNRFVSGKIKVWKADGTQELVDMTAEDTNCSVAVNDRLYADIIGLDLDPKDLRRAAAHEMMQPSNVENTETLVEVESKTSQTEPSES